MTDHRKLTITVDADVYEGLQAVVGRGHISRFLSDLARPHVVRADLEKAYAAMAAEREREAKAEEWAEGLVEDAASERD